MTWTSTERFYGANVEGNRIFQNIWFFQSMVSTFEFHYIPHRILPDFKSISQWNIWLQILTIILVLDRTKKIWIDSNI